MRIAFNGHRLAGQRLGVGRYIEYLLRYWSDMLTDAEEVSLFLRQPLDDNSLDNLRLSSNIGPEVLGPDMPGIPWENLRLRWPAATHDVLFCPAYTAPVGYRYPMVVATHSVNEIDRAAHSWRYRQTYGRLYGHSARSADAVIVPAEATRSDVRRLLGVPDDRIFVVPQGVDTAFRPLDDASVLSAARVGFFGTDRPYVLFVGKCSVRRNIPLLLRAFARVRKAGFPHGLVLFGPNVSDLALAELTSDLGISADVVQTDGKVTSHQELVAIYNAADVFVHPSLYEGWSMTTVEALACGTAVIAANRGGLAEAVAGHGILLDELSEQALADAIERVLGDDALRRDLEHQAYERGRTLRWHQTAELTLDVLRAVAAR